MYSVKPVQMQSITLHYSNQDYGHSIAIQKIKKDEYSGEAVTKSLQSIQVHLNNGMSSPVVPFNSEDNCTGSEQLLHNFHI